MAAETDDFAIGDLIAAKAQELPAAISESDALERSSSTPLLEASLARLGKRKRSAERGKGRA
jgi:hypothetical protein